MKRLLLFLTMALTLFGVSRAEDEVVATCLFGSSYNSKGQSSYENSWTSSNGGFTWDITNANNSNNSWGYIKIGNNKNDLTGSITTQAPLGRAITKVDLTIDAITVGSVSSIKLYTSSDNSNYTEIGSFTKAKGTQTVTISNPQPNLYYKIEVSCTKASSNGPIQISKVEYYAASEKTSVSLSFPQDNYDAVLSEEFVMPILTVTPNEASSEVKYKSSDTSVAEVDEINGNVTLKGAGETTISASIIDSQNYNNAIAEYQLTVHETTPSATDEIISSNFTGISYTVSKEWTSPSSQATYKAQATSNNGFQMRTSKDGCGIYVMSAPKGMKVSNIKLEFSTAGGGVSVYSSDKQISSATGTAIETGVNTTKTIEINAPYFLIVPTNDSYTTVSKVTVNWIEDNESEVPGPEVPELQEYSAPFNGQTYNIKVGETFSLTSELGETYPEVIELILPDDQNSLEETEELLTVKALAAGTVKVEVMWEEDENFTEGDASFTIIVEEATVDPDPTPGGDSTEITDILTLSSTTASGNSYSDWTVTDTNSGAVYAGNSAGSYDCIQLRSDTKSNTAFSGIVSTTSGGEVTKVSVTWNSNTSSGRKLDIYARETAYTSTSELYGDTPGEKIGSIDYGTSTELTIPAGYSYIGMRSNSGAMYLSEIDITWSQSSTTDPEPSEPVEYSAPFNGQTYTIKVGETFSLTSELGETYPEVIELILPDDQNSLEETEELLTVKALAAGTVKVEVMWEDDENFTEGDAYFTIVVEEATVDPDPTETLTATVIMKDQEDLSYGNGKKITWKSSDGKFEFSTIATITGNTYPTKSGDNLRIYNSNGNVVTVNAPENYYFVTASYELATSDNHIAINGTDCASDNNYTFEDYSTSFELTSVQSNSNKNSDIKSMTFVLAKLPRFFDVKTYSWDKEWSSKGNGLGIAFMCDGDDYSTLLYDEISFEIKPLFETEGGTLDEATDGGYSDEITSISWNDEKAELEVLFPCSGLYEIIAIPSEGYAINKSEKPAVIGTANIYPAFDGITLSYENNEEESGIYEFKGNKFDGLKYRFEVSNDNELNEKSLKPNVEIETGENVEVWYKIHGLEDETVLESNKRRISAAELPEGFVKIDNGTIDLSSIYQIEGNTSKQISFVLSKNGATTPLSSNPGDDSELTSEVMVTISKGDNHVTGVDSVFGEAEGEVEYYTLEGIKVNADNLQNGIYVAKKGQKAVKVLIQK